MGGKRVGLEVGQWMLDGRSMIATVLHGKRVCLPSIANAIVGIRGMPFAVGLLQVRAQT